MESSDFVNAVNNHVKHYTLSIDYTTPHSFDTFKYFWIIVCLVFYYIFII